MRSFTITTIVSHPTAETEGSEVSRVLAYVGTLILGIVVGASGSEYLRERAAPSIALANLFRAGECLRNSELLCAMRYAQSSLFVTPYAYDPYEVIGDVYIEMGNPSAGREMYEQALQRLAEDAESAMLISPHPESANRVSELIRQKLDALES